MHIKDIPENSQIAIIASIDKIYMEFTSRVVGVRAGGVVVEAIKTDDGKSVSLASDKIKLDVSYVDDEEKSPFIWKNITSSYVKIGKNFYHILFQDSEGKRENRRGAFRLFIGEDAYLNLLSKAVNVPVILKDISTTGFAFVFREELPINKFCSVSCVIDNCKLVLSGFIVRKQPMENGNIIYGCKMEKFSKELERFIAKKQREAINNKLR